MKMTDEFKVGALIAVSTLNHQHDEPTICWDALADMGITKDDIPDDLNEFDKEQLEIIFASARR